MQMLQQTHQSVKLQ
ncbi:unnamed protein product [Timema podura]|uniref:Uncharacterized protein n=1 Tax=Timema podura TaxID=61482 RepID=A0ABN7NUF6_TIMPD|nr:unnamed protein product [Timema podura]